MRLLTVGLFALAAGCGTYDDESTPMPETQGEVPSDSPLEGLDLVAVDDATLVVATLPSATITSDGQTCTATQPILSATEAASLSGALVVTRLKTRIDEALDALAVAGTWPGCRGATRYVVDLAFPKGNIRLDPGGGSADPVASSRRDAAIELRDPRFAELSGNKRLEISGRGMDSTTLTVPLDTVAVTGRNARYVTFRDLHFTQDTGANKFKVSQGLIRRVAVSDPVVSAEYPSGRRYHYVDVLIDPGFPMPVDIDADRSACRDGNKGQGNCARGGRWLRRYIVDSNGMPRFDQSPDNEHVEWLWARGPINGEDRVYRLYLDTGHPYAPGERIAIKSKHGATSAYLFQGGEKIAFIRVRWSQEARGTFHDTDYVTVEGCRVEPVANPNGPRPMLATSAGGPQFGNDPRLRETGEESGSSCAAINNTFVGTGDDALAFANMTWGPNGEHTRINGNSISESFARGILMSDVGGSRTDTYPEASDRQPWDVFRLAGNTVTGCPIVLACSTEHARRNEVPVCTGGR